MFVFAFSSFPWQWAAGALQKGEKRKNDLANYRSVSSLSWKWDGLPPRIFTWRGCGGLAQAALQLCSLFLFLKGPVNGTRSLQKVTWSLPPNKIESDLVWCMTTALTNVYLANVAYILLWTETCYWDQQVTFSWIICCCSRFDTPVHTCAHLTSCYLR